MLVIDGYNSEVVLFTADRSPSHPLHPFHMPHVWARAVPLISDDISPQWGGLPWGLVVEAFSSAVSFCWVLPKHHTKHHTSCHASWFNRAVRAWHSKYVRVNLVECTYRRHLDCWTHWLRPNNCRFLSRLEKNGTCVVEFNPGQVATRFTLATSKCQRLAIKM